jgi:hypothetical protein
MEPIDSLPCSQGPSIGPYPGPDQSVHTTPSYLEDNNIINEKIQLSASWTARVCWINSATHAW